MFTIPLHFIVLFLLVAAAFYKDHKQTKIPNVLTIGGVVAGLMYHLITAKWEGLIFSLSGFATGLLVLLVLYIFGALGAGDVKFFGAIGSITGVEFVMYSAMYSILFASVIGVIIVLLRREFMKRIRNVFYSIISLLLLRNLNEIKQIKDKDPLRFPFMYAVLPGVTAAYYYFYIIQ